ncbi:MAG: hypothetical protein WC390_07075 [Sulfurimonas sp.]|jgi:hypothetical protein
MNYFDDVNDEGIRDILEESEPETYCVEEQFEKELRLKAKEIQNKENLTDKQLYDVLHEHYKEISVKQIKIILKNK